MCTMIVSKLYIELCFETTGILLRLRVAGLTFTYFICYKLCSLLLTGGVKMKQSSCEHQSDDHFTDECWIFFFGRENSGERT